MVSRGENISSISDTISKENVDNSITSSLVLLCHTVLADDLIQSLAIESFYGVSVRATSSGQEVRIKSASNLLERPDLLLFQRTNPSFLGNSPSVQLSSLPQMVIKGLYEYPVI